MNILDGRKIRDAHRKYLIEYVSKLNNLPKLAIIQVGDEEASNIYIEQKKRFGKSIGVLVEHIKLPMDVSFEELGDLIKDLNNNNKVHGIIIQLPLPGKFNSQKVIDLISVDKDVDGLTTEQQKFTPATARGILTLLRDSDVLISGKRVVVIGRSKLVGGPTARLMEKEGAKVKVCHRGTKNIPEETQKADIIIVAAGHPNLVTKNYVKPGQVVVDVGISTISGESLDDRQIVGDVHFKEVSQIVDHISPVPGGVGPMTVLSLFENLIDAYKLCNN